MQVVKVATPEEWLERAGPLLLADEARHNLILGLAGTLRDHPDLYPDFGLWLAEDAGEVAGAALRTRPHNLVLGPASPEAAELLAAALDEELPGVVGCAPEVDRFVAARGGARPRFAPPESSSPTSGSPTRSSTPSGDAYTPPC